MFFVSKKKYNKMIDQYEEERKELIRQLNDINDEKTEIKLRYDCLKSDRVNTETVLKQNNKLIDWIEKILKEVNTCQVNDRRAFIIPIYKDNGSIYYKDRASNNIYEEHEEVTIIPEIIIKKVRIGD